jgi:rhamnosyltransferase
MTSPFVHASVVIPTKNCMPGFIRVFESVARQKTPWPFEIIVIDSGSHDGTAEYARRQNNTRVLCIPPKSFGHGRTRNEAIAEAKGHFVALLTHDAQPADENWLANIVRAVEQDDRIAGAFGRHLAYPWADPYTVRDLRDHFEGFLNHPLVVNRDTNATMYEQDERWRQFLHFYSNNNSCLRRSVWERIPYPDVEFAEDQIWAKKIIELGYSKAYAPDAVVYHSHDYRLRERLQRSFDESRAFNKLFGYRLCDGVHKVILGGARLAVRDWLYATRSREVNALTYGRRIATNFMNLLGHYLGSKHEKLPAWLANSLSWDRRFLARAVE